MAMKHKGAWKPAQELQNEPTLDIPLQRYQNPYESYPNNLGLGPNDFHIFQKSEDILTCQVISGPDVP